MILLHLFVRGMIGSQEMGSETVHLSNAMLKWVRLVPDSARTLLLHDFLNVE